MQYFILFQYCRMYMQFLTGLNKKKKHFQKHRPIAIKYCFNQKLGCAT